jgi:hypothetical protein
MTNIVAKRFAANLRPGDGAVIRTGDRDVSSIIVDAVDTFGTLTYVFALGTAGALMGQPYVFRLPFDFEVPLTYAVA